MRSFLAALMLWAFMVPANAEEVCTASVYSIHSHDQNGTRTASGIPLNDNIATIAHRLLPLRSMARVTNLATGKSLLLKVTDRGPYFEVNRRCVDLSVRAARDLGCAPRGLCRVSVQAQ